MNLLHELKQRIMLLDGAMGTLLQQRGLRAGQCPESLNLERPEVIEDIHRAYIEAGSDIVQTNTFGANRFKLAEYGLENRVREINRLAVEAARRAAGDDHLVALSVGPTGRMLPPMGDVTFDQLYDAFAEQMTVAEKAGADLISVETMMDIGELRAALIAARSCTRLPVIAHLTFEPDGRTLTGTDPVTVVKIIEGLGALAVGANCSGGAEQLLPVIRAMSRATDLYISVEPNAGLPVLINGKTVFPETPEGMAGRIRDLVEAGANIIGGCCGSTPQHIAAIAEVLRGIKPAVRAASRSRALCSRTKTVFIDKDHYPVFIGERINPTARKKLAQDIMDGRLQMVVDEAISQVEAGAPILDINMGVPGIDEIKTMADAVLKIQAAVDVPISIDSTSAEAVEAALKNFVGRPLINSTTGEAKAMEKIFPLARKYGAAVLGLCMDESGIPDTAEGRVAIARKIWAKAQEYGLRREDIYIDCLVKTASAEQDQVMETLKALSMVRNELGLGTVLGISNVSHGLPARDILNSTFLAMAYSHGLDMPIANPFDQRIKETIMAAAVLTNLDPYAAWYIDALKDYKAPAAVTRGTSTAAAAEHKSVEPSDPIKDAVIKGKRETIVELIKQELALRDPMDIVNGSLIPGIEEVGNLYDRKIYFLPQLMLSAETMKEGFSFLKPYLTREEGRNKGTIVMATVEGDIHDIGKNMVCLMLENYGFNVIDLGKDVPAQRILAAAQEHNADVIGLSALMTTTMPRMLEVINLAKDLGLKAKIVVGGAVLTPEYAEKIRADGYSPDARAAVICIRNLLNNR